MYKNLIPFMLAAPMVFVGILGISQAAGDFSVQVSKPGQYWVGVLQNSDILVKYTGGRGADKTTMITVFQLKDGGVNNAGGSYGIDDPSWNAIGQAAVVEDTDTRKTTRQNSDPSSHYGDRVQYDYIIWKAGPFIKISYTFKKYAHTWDNCAVGGTTGSTAYKIYGKSDKSNINRPGANLAYRGYMIMGVYNPVNGQGYGRIMPVDRINEVKLAEVSFRGFEVFFKSGSQINTYLFAFKNAPSEVLTLGKAIVDWALAGENPNAIPGSTTGISLSPSTKIQSGINIQGNHNRQLVDLWGRLIPGHHTNLAPGIYFLIKPDANTYQVYKHLHLK